MNESSSSFRSELRISPRWVIVALMAISVILAFVSDERADSSERLQVQLLALAFFAASAIATLVDNWAPRASRWCAIIAPLIMVHLSSALLGNPGFLNLVAIPTALAAALVSLPGATVVAVVETALLLSLPKDLIPGQEPTTVISALIGTWAILGVMYAVYQPVHRVAHWSWEYFQWAHRLLEEARSHQLKLNQALTDLKDANLQLTRLNIVAQRLRRTAEAARAAKEQFVANVSHELRTPLNMIVGFSETIVQVPEIYDGRIPPALLADLAVIYRNAEHLSDLIDDVLDLSRIEAGQMALTREYVHFHEIVKTAATAVRPLFDSKGLYLRVDLPGDLPPVLCDRTRIREVLLNLLSNAGRFTEHGGVQVRVWKEGNDVVVAVADTGPGIAAKDLSKLFQPFHQVDGSIRRRYGGTGLGLSISKRFIELHGGRIWVESQEGLGTTFTFRMPVDAPATVDDSYLRGLTPGWEYWRRTRPSLAPKATLRPRFVAFEQGDSLRRLLSRYLNEVEIVPVTSLEQALEELSRAPTQALLVNGNSVSKDLEWLITSAKLPSDTPAIICSIPGRDAASATLGVFDRLVKPVSRETLLSALDRIGIREGTILIVDDEPDALHLFGRMLTSSRRRYRVLLARDGREAIHILREYRPDLILLDLIMPNMDGFQLLAMRDQEPALRDVPIIVVSARDPAGQPIVSSALAITRGGGLSVHQLLTSIKAVSEILSSTGQAGDPVPTRVLSAQPASG